MSSIWYKGICDDLLWKIALWNSAYWKGEIHSTRQFLDTKGELVDKATKCAHKVPFRQQELDHLVRIASELRPGSVLLEELKKVRSLWKHGKAVQGSRYMHEYWKQVPLPPGLHRVITLAFYPEHAKAIVDLLIEARAGISITAENREGKDLFEQ